MPMFQKIRFAANKPKSTEPGVSAVTVMLSTRTELSTARSESVWQRRQQADVRRHQPDSVQQSAGNRTMQPFPPGERSPRLPQQCHNHRRHDGTGHKPDGNKHKRREMSQADFGRYEG
jgi:hypothetical protein